LFNAALLYCADKFAMADCQDRLHAEDKLHVALQAISLTFDPNIAKRWPERSA
jgi:hypothetical protein